MRSLIVTEFITLDGIVDSPGQGDHPQAGWTWQDIEPDEDSFDIKIREQEEAEALLVGRITYDEIAPVWPQMEEFARYNAMPKYVVSSSLDEGSWAPTTILRSLDEVAELKAGDGGPILVQGSPTLAQNLAAAGLVDRYHLMEFPVVLGSGKRLFGEKDVAKLTLVESASYANGVRMAVYDVRH